MLITIKLARYGNKPVTRHAVARNVTAWSRSTTYRKIGKMVKMGLVRVGVLDKPNELLITKKGYEFLSDFIMLKGLEENG